MKKTHCLFRLMTLLTMLVGIQQQVFAAKKEHRTESSYSSPSSSSHHTRKKCSKKPGTWTPLRNQPTFFQGASTPLLLTDGSLLMQEESEALFVAFPAIWKLTPDDFGSYVNGTWTQLASLPVITSTAIGSISGTTLTITSTDTLGASILSSVDQTVTGAGVLAGTQIVQPISVKTDGSGTYLINNSQTVASEQLTISVQYAPAAYASAVLADGRVIFAGGEYNDGNFLQAEESLCAIYDPVTNVWTPFAPPAFFNNLPRTNLPLPVGDASSVVLFDGTFMLANSVTSQAALLDAKNLTWTETGVYSEYNDNNEEGWTLLPNGKVLTVNTYTSTGFFSSVITTDVPGIGPFISLPSQASALGSFTFPITGTGAISSPDISGCNGPLDDLTGEIAVLLYSGQCSSGHFITNFAAANATAVIAVSNISDAFSIGGGSGVPYSATISTEDGAVLMAAVTENPGMQITISQVVPSPDTTNSFIYDPKCGTWTSAGSTIVTLGDPVFFEMGPGVLRPDGTVIAFGSSGHNAIYNSKTGKWRVASDFPIDPIDGQQACFDAPAALMPNGNVLVATNSTGPGVPPVHFYEFTYCDNTFVAVPPIPNAENISSALCSMIVLPTGQILQTTGTDDVEIYTPANREYNPDWAPKVSNAPEKVRAGKTYKICGIRFNGMSQASMFGDDQQHATNYPLVRITNNKTGRVFYCRTHDHSFMGVASDKEVHTFFDVPANVPSGKYKLEVVANGIPSKPITVHVKG